MKEIKEILEKHKMWLDNEKGGVRADLRGANLCDADLRGSELRNVDLCGAALRDADLRGAELDFSCWPLWCGSQGVKVDIKLVRQLLAHVYALNCEDEEFEKVKKVNHEFAVKTHRAKDFGVRTN